MEKNSSKHRRRNPLVVGVGALVLLVIVAVPALWWIARDQVSNAVAAAQYDAARQGYTLTHQGLDFSGFPFHLSAALASPRVDWGQGSWRGPGNITGETSFTNPTAVRLDGSGQHELSIDRLSMTIDSREALAVIGVGKQGAEAIEAALRDLDLQLDQGLGQARLESLELAAAPLPPLKQDGEAMAVSLDLKNLLLPKVLGLRVTELGGRVQDGSLRAEVTGPLRPGPTPQMLANWRDGGGKLDLKSLLIHWGPVAIEAKGKLGLDSKMRAEGRLNLQISGFPKLLNALAQLGKLDPVLAGTYGGLLGGMAQPRNGKSGRWLAIPLVLQNGQAFLSTPFAKIPLARLQPLVPTG